MLADALQQRLLDRRLVGFRVRAARQANGTKAAAARGCDGARRRIEIAVVSRLDAAVRQPTMRREQTSLTNAVNPTRSQVGTYVKSTTQSPFGASA